MGRLIDAVLPARMGTPFRWLVGSAWASNLGDGIALAAGPLLVASQTSDPFVVALAGLLQRLPWLLFGLYVGVLADRVDRRLIALRHDEPVVALGDFAMLLPEHEDVYAFTRALADDVLLVVCNVSRRPYELAELLPDAVDCDLVLGNLPDPGPTLRPWEARVLRPR